MFRLPWRKAGKVLQEKLDLIDFAFSRFALVSMADLGGVWGVQGAYTFQTLTKRSVQRACLVDTDLTEEVVARAAEFPALELISGNFGSPAVAAKIGKIDAVLLFDVLLHQVAPNWDDILAMYANQCRCFIVYNQQWVGEGDVVRLLELGEEEYFRNVPHNRSVPPYLELFERLDEIHPQHGRSWRDVHHIWQWGISDAALEKAMERLGFTLALKRNFGRFGRLDRFENHGFVYVK
jgi:hypothetical protein